MNDILNTCHRLYLQQMLMLGNFILGIIRLVKTSWINMIDLSRPYVLMAYDCMGIHYTRNIISTTDHWHLIVSMRHPEVGDIPVDSKFENALNTKIPEKASNLICKYADIPIESDMNIDDILVEIMNGDGEIRGFRGDDIINRF